MTKKAPRNFSTLSDLDRYSAILKSLTIREPFGIIPIIDPTHQCLGDCRFKRGEKWYCPQCHAVAPDVQSILDNQPVILPSGGPTKYIPGELSGGRS